MRMKYRTLAALLSVVMFIQGCGSMAIVDIPQPGENRSSCGGICTTTDRNTAAALNTLAWIGIVYAGLFLGLLALNELLKTDCEGDCNTITCEGDDCDDATGTLRTPIAW